MTTDSSAMAHGGARDIDAPTGVRRWLTGDRLDILLAALLGIAAVFTAWAAYQSALLGGDASKGFTEATRTSAAANAASNASSQIRINDQALFLEYATAAQQENLELVAYLRTSLMRPELVAAIEWWEATPDGPDSPTSPFVPENPNWTDAESVKAAELNAQAVTQVQTAERLDKRGDSFDLVTVILATSLFLLGIASVFKQPKIKLAMGMIGAVALVAALIRLIDLGYYAG